MIFGEFSDVKEYIKKEKVELLDLKYVDLNGRWRHVTLPATADSYVLLKEGMGFDGSSVGYAKTHSSDMILLIPDLSTGMIDPFWERKALSFLCEVAEADSRHPFPFDPRSVAKRAEDHLNQMAWVDASTWGPELEFNVFDRVSYDIRMNQSSYQIISGESVFGSEDLNSGVQILPGDGYHAIPPADTLYELRSEIADCLESIGIEIKYHHHEVGAAGQLEIEIPMAGLLRTADTIMLIKYVVKMICQKRGKSVTFMPKPLHGDSGNGMHVHQTLWKGKQNLFYDQKGYSGLSNTALSYIAGLFEHSTALLAFTNPSTNSYRRLVPGFEAPTNLFFSAGNRLAAVRIPKYATSKKNQRIEFRPPDATCNIYLCLTAQLLAGLDGIEKNMESRDYGPIDEDIHTWPEEKIKNLKALPASLDEALEGLKHDYEFLLRGDIFSQELIKAWIEYKIKRELNPIRGMPHPYEFALYYNT
jgi:glutamine synthetase